jgi:multidrug transporter EmrE-like cation transporter
MPHFTGLTTLALITCILMETFEQVCFKYAAKQPEQAKQWYARGIAGYLFNITVWFWLLSVLPLGFALPLIGATYITVALASQFLFGERISPRRWKGILLIVIGFALVWSEL